GTPVLLTALGTIGDSARFTLVIPEPASLALLGIGTLLLARRMRGTGRDGVAEGRMESRLHTSLLRFPASPTKTGAGNGAARLTLHSPLSTLHAARTTRFVPHPHARLR